MKAFNQRGEGKAGFVFGLLVLALVVYAAVKVVPVLIRAYSYEDAVKGECANLRGRTADQLQEDLVTLANQEGLPINENNVIVSKRQVEDHTNLKVDIEYTVPISTPVRVFNINKAIHYDAPVFD